ncbi:integration host factor subunit beta [Basilea psittacipulmonis]|uniref:Integration host factor subunit beta n=1 Tax=Basilea psittacipulmonis DSM 24701 TaxID=1072685 RepID=A0A077DIB9_9BURK|nr:integration host factor subunit beta [Basilea psittacipulmonis]AIL32913.1 integration host factor subunit beta [Basilea psittacipulmonis DSM 24701]
MTKSELIEALSLQFPQFPARDSELAVRVLLDEMINTLADGGRIEVRGFGSFALTHREARMGRNPKSGEPVEVPAKWVPHFKPGKELRQRVDAKFQGK